MRIPSDTLKAPSVPAIAAVKRATAGESLGSAPTEPSIKVSVSREAKALAASEERPVDMKKVERLRALVERGELKIDPAMIADRILASEA
ncbi:MAG: flagellar biosynthesis anti-sigma factor FlgM [Polyangiaceae bacterium]|nr:flagellar biosynthesis anti-sigma factor FlgM [Polyangiaceae bacterium]